MEHDHEHMMMDSAPDAGFWADILKQYVPRYQCMYHETNLIALHVVSDFLIAAAYFSIPLALIMFARRRKDVAFHWMFMLFAAFIMLCGTTHIFGIISIWHSFYRVDGIIKFATALASVGTAVLLWKLMPAALALPSIDEVRRRGDSLETLVQERTDELNAAKDRAEAASRAKSEFIANMSHEIRTPMNAIVGLTEILQMNSVPEEKRAAFLGTMASSADQLLRLINDLLDFEKIESRNLRLEQIPFCLIDILEEVINVQQVQTERRRLRLNLEAPPEADRMYVGDPHRIKQVLINLIGNAVKFTEKGEITVVISLKDNNGAIDCRIAVKDTGIGISREKQEEIFGKFVQADNSITRKFGGTGLGLSITKSLVELMGGRISVESQLHVGSTFTVQLPLALSHDQNRKAAAPLQRFNAAPATAVPSKGRALIVEDNEGNIVLMRETLEQLGFVCAVARNGDEALVALADQNFDVILMDLQMPKVDGFTATRIIRDNERGTGRRTPILGVSAHAMKEDAQRCKDAGMDDYLAKPFRPAQLEEALKKVMGEI